MKAMLVRPDALNTAVGKQLESLEQIQAPAWANYVKTGSHKQRAPSQDNWWHLRCAALLRQVALKGPIGTQKLRVLYGGRKNRGHKPNAFRKASGSVIRRGLQQLEQAGLIKQDSRKGHKGRIVTPAGHSLLDKAANEVLK